MNRAAYQAASKPTQPQQGMVAIPPPTPKPWLLLLPEIKPTEEKIQHRQLRGRAFWSNHARCFKVCLPQAHGTQPSARSSASSQTQPAYPDTSALPLAIYRHVQASLGAPYPKRSGNRQRTRAAADRARAARTSFGDHTSSGEASWALIGNDGDWAHGLRDGRVPPRICCVCKRPGSPMFSLH